MKLQIPELLAPAGSMEALKAAINAGADAVYLAGKQFGARHYAANFDDNELKEAIRYAHLRRVKVYVTVNTLIKDYELQNVAKYLLFLYEIGVDAILVQDIGVAKLAKELVPDLDLHASTQMTIHNIEGVKWASEFGFKRVVLAREMKIAEIEEIGGNLKYMPIELEIFAHGALCYSYSGQCLLSSFIGGRSGNRGMCAQPCRKPYDLILGEKDEYGRPFNTTKVEIMQSIIEHQKSKIFEAKIKDKYLLSTRDLAIYEDLDRVSKSSISSLKIEGRMRSPEYVAIVVSIYRKALDLIAKDRWKPGKKDINDLKLAFNRGFTGGYLLENKENAVMGRDQPGNRGVYIGSVIDYKKKDKEVVVEIENDIIPEKGDGIVFINLNHDRDKYGMAIHHSPTVYKNKARFIVQHPQKSGTLVYITRRRSLIDRAQKIIRGAQSKFKHQIKVDLDVLIENNGCILLKSKFNGPNNASIEMEIHPDFKMQTAIKKPITEEIIEKQFRKTGGTPFIMGNINIQYPGDLFAPIGELNRLRRELFEKIEEKLISMYCPDEDKIKQVHDKLSKLLLQLDVGVKNIQINKKSVNLAVYVDSLEILKGAVEGNCDKVYFDPFTPNALVDCKYSPFNEETLKSINEAISICKNSNVEFTLKLPKITSNSFLAALNPLLTEVPNSEINGIMVDGIGAAKAISNFNPQIHLFASAGLNIWNYMSIKELNNIFKGFTISPELSKEEIRTISLDVQKRKIDTKLELLVQGNLESIVSKDCMPHIAGDKLLKDKHFLGIEDIKNHLFPIRLDNECRTHILNSVELCLVDYMPQISNSCIDTIIIDARGRTKKYARDMSSIYKKAIKIGAKSSRKSKSDLNALKNKAKKISLGGITTGNFIRGVTEE